MPLNSRWDAAYVEDTNTSTLPEIYHKVHITLDVDRRYEVHRSSFIAVPSLSRSPLQHLIIWYAGQGMELSHLAF